MKISAEAREAMDDELLQELADLFENGAGLDQLLDILVEREKEKTLYSFYLALVCGKKLSGSVFASRWAREDQHTKEQILFHLEVDANEVRRARGIPVPAHTEDWAWEK